MSHDLRQPFKNITAQSPVLSRHSETEPVVLSKGAFLDFKYKVFFLCKKPPNKHVFQPEIDFNA